ncbi:MAG: sodium:solute symporter family protein [Deltaproteobacteria bacterium]|nr:sodium:solute symporter family protein [Deltaproteobacteria bacterium]
MDTPSVPPEVALWVGVGSAVYLVVVLALAAFAQRRVDSMEDYVVAGRRLTLGLASATLLATWFGAGTLLAVADEVRAEGLRAAALDPIGAGVCLVLAGLFFARKMWSLKLVTLADLFRRRFGPRVEVFSGALLVPVYFGWIAAQLVALAQLLELFFGLPVAAGLAAVAAFGIFYTALGGMWAVTLTDGLQMALLLVGLVILTGAVALHFGDSVGEGATAVWQQVPDGHRIWIPRESLAEAGAWLGVFCAGSLGNLPSQDLMQRIFAARSAKVAQAACLVAGGAYLTFGLLPLFLGLAGHVIDAEGGSTLPMLAGIALHPGLAVLLVVTLLSAVLSTLDSAILAPATVIAQNLWRTSERVSPLQRTRIAVVGVGLVSVGVAYLGESAYSLLESGYELGMVSLLVPLVVAVHLERPSVRAVVVAMGLGTSLWLAAQVAGLESLGPVPVGLASTAAATMAYALVARLAPGTRAEPLAVQSES